MYFEQIDCAVIGAGVVGLAVARALALQGREVMVLESAGLIGSGISSRNSEVIHAGIYYPPSSLKAEFCVAGKSALYRYIKERGIDYRQCGKLLVATNTAQLQKLQSIMANAAQNGVDDLVRLGKEDVMALEPECHCVGAVLSPSTGIIDTHGLMLSLQGDIEAARGMVILNAHVTSAETADGALLLEVETQGETMRLQARSVINSAGLAAPEIARSMKGYPRSLVPDCYFAKGNYFTLATKAPFRHLLYPVPDESAGLGIHLTLDINGQARFGPDVEWIDHIDYDVDPERAQLFYPAIRRYWPGLPDGSLLPGYSGIRPKIQAPGTPAADFLILGPDDHHINGLVHLFGIESPGLTSSLAIGEHVAKILSHQVMKP